MTGQTSLLCGCGGPDNVGRGLCSRCLRRARLSRERFAGLRELALQRDSYQCQCCGELDTRLVLVHHRRPGFNRLRYFVTICRRCHVRVHLTCRPCFAFATNGLLYQLWAEVHRRTPKQRLLALLEDDKRAYQAGLFEG